MVIKGTTLGVPTDIDGKFSLSFAEQSNVVFVFFFRGNEKAGDFGDR